MLRMVGVLVAAMSVFAISMVMSHPSDDDFDFQSKLLKEPDPESESDHARDFVLAETRTAPELAAPTRLTADGKPIDIGRLSGLAHAGPCVADIDGDGDRDLLVGDFPGYFWHFDNAASDRKPEYTLIGKLQAGGVDAKTPIY